MVVLSLLYDVMPSRRKLVEVHTPAAGSTTSLQLPPVRSDAVEDGSRVENCIADLGHLGIISAVCIDSDSEEDNCVFLAESVLASLRPALSGLLGRSHVQEGISAWEDVAWVSTVEEGVVTARHDEVSICLSNFADD